MRFDSSSRASRLLGKFIASSPTSSGINGELSLQNGVLHRLPKFEVDFGCSNAKTNLIEREVTVASVFVFYLLNC